jgi:invasion protein IalB
MITGRRLEVAEAMPQRRKNAMMQRRKLGPRRINVRRGVVAGTAALAMSFGPAQAQQAAQTPKAHSNKPSSQPAAPAAEASVPPAPQFFFSPWTKICGKDGPEDSDAKQVCAVLSSARVEDGKIAVSVALVEPADGARNILRVTLPLGVRLPYGTRVIIDQGTPVQSGYIMCVAGCISDYDAGPDLVEKLKKGHNLEVQAINPGGSPISANIPLEGFGEAFDGPATDEKVAAAQQKKLEEQLKARAEETRKKLEAEPGAGTPSRSQASNPPTAGK